MRQSRQRRERLIKWRVKVASALVVMMALTSGCFLDHDVEQYYGRAVAPRTQEFRWSDGGLPRVFDPAMAAVPPDTDAVRAMFEGLTEYDSRSLAPVPGVASRWESSVDAREWTFHLRRDARWSNNDPVTAQDFVRSWQRTLQLGDRAPHARLLRNIQGAIPVELIPAPSVTAVASPTPAQRERTGEQDAKNETKQEQTPTKFGAEAVDDFTLRVRLSLPDPSFPALVSHPVFRPIHKVDEAQDKADATSTQRPVSNGAFHLTNVAADGVVLERARNYWDAQAVTLQRVRFISSPDAESALQAYRAGDVDAVTNAGFEPLALKLLAPYKDFRRATFGALTYYSFNLSRAPFSDVRVREALSITIDRDRISEDELGGATEPAKRFLPAQIAPSSDAGRVPLIERNVSRARTLLAEAGYPNGHKFPKIKLLINRNAQQREVAEAIAEMWRSSLNIETEVIPKDWSEYEISIRAGDYDIARRSYVMQSADELSSLRDMLEPVLSGPADSKGEQPTTAEDKATEAQNDETKKPIETPPAAPRIPPSPVYSEAQAIRELPAMPIYFASSYALVRPYVIGFESNLLDAPSLKHVRIETEWQQPKQATVIWFKAGE